MVIVDLFSHRRQVAEGKTPDVFVYDELSRELRVQIVHIWREAIGSKNYNSSGWEQVHGIVAREHGVFELASGQSAGGRCERYLLGEPSVEHALDLIEAAFFYVDRVAKKFTYNHRRSLGITCSAADAIDELNKWFRRAGVGYKFEQARIFRVDSELIHAEVVQPALRCLSEPGFEGPRDEFLNAHTHYRAGEMKDAITDANNAFESTLRAVCDKRGWPYERGVPASVLLKILRENGLLPDYLDKAFDQLVATLNSGLPQVRHNEGGHGQGATPREAPDYVAGYALHLAAANILFIVEAHKTFN